MFGTDFINQPGLRRRATLGLLIPVYPKVNVGAFVNRNVRCTVCIGLFVLFSRA